jgi:hypothetical protein
VYFLWVLCCLCCKLGDTTIIKHLRYEPEYKQKVISVLQRLKEGNIDKLKNQSCFELFTQLKGHWDKKYGQSRFANRVGFLRECIRLLDETDRFSLYVPKDSCKALPGDSLGMSCYNKLCKRDHH